MINDKILLAMSNAYLKKYLSDFRKHDKLFIRKLCYGLTRLHMKTFDYIDLTY